MGPKVPKQIKKQTPFSYTEVLAYFFVHIGGIFNSKLSHNIQSFPTDRLTDRVPRSHDECHHVNDPAEVSIQHFEQLLTLQLPHV